MMKITGLEICVDRLRSLPPKVQKKITRTALREGAKDILQAARGGAPIGATGVLKKSIKIRTQRRKGKIKLIVGSGKKWFTGKAFYAAFVEFGHKIGKRARTKVARALQALKGGDRRKQVEPKPFLEEAYTRRRLTAVNLIRQSFIRGIEEAAKGSEPSDGDSDT